MELCLILPIYTVTGLDENARHMGCRHIERVFHVGHRRMPQCVKEKPSTVTRRQAMVLVKKAYSTLARNATFLLRNIFRAPGKMLIPTEMKLCPTSRSRERLVHNASPVLVVVCAGEKGGLPLLRDSFGLSQYFRFEIFSVFQEKRISQQK
jgi:hypothetical protein